MKLTKVAFGVAVAGSLLVTGGGAAHAATSQGGVVHLTEIDEPNHGPEIDLFTGAIADHGTDITPNSNTVAKIKLTKGTIVISLNQAAFNKGKFTEDPTNCSQSYIASAPVKVASGTGAYAGIKGSFTATINQYGIAPKLASGKCNNANSADPVFQMGYVTATGTISYG